MQTIYGATTSKSVAVTCGVRSNPLSDLRFEWTFNSTSTGNVRLDPREATEPKIELPDPEDGDEGRPRVMSTLKFSPKVSPRVCTHIFGDEDEVFSEVLGSRFA